MTFIVDRNAYKAALLYASCGQEVIAGLYLRKAYGGNYVNPATSTSIEEVVTEANNLNELLDLMHLCFKE